MKVSETSFRSVYHQLCYISKNKAMENVMANAGFPYDNRVTGALVYGYIDHTVGLSFELLAFASMVEDGGIRPFNGNDEVTIKFREGSVADCDILILNGDVSQFQDKIDMVNEGYACSEAVAALRDMVEIDARRNEECPDDVIVLLMKNGLRPEGCWVRCEQVGEKQIEGILLNEPDQDFGVHMGNMIGFTLAQQNGQIHCVAML